ncbi:MAG: exostosin family protein, partial [Planctomycetes bacterium]|nr:exostosin family protein [Planctomycetota bacterium]
RGHVLGLRDAGGLIRDTHSEPGRGYGQSPATYERYKEAYARDLQSVQFVLCPRGVGASSMRIFEAMKAGRAPVIISDDWTPPAGPHWTEFSLRVAEADVVRVPSLLAEHAQHAHAMGQRAREAWERWFSPESAFQTMGAEALRLVRHADRWDRLRRIAHYRSFLTREGARRLRASMK